MMDPEEAELLNDYRYRSYAAVIEKALRNFESSSEWADLISSLGKLNKALQSNLKYSLLPRRLIIGKRLAQCLHPALPSGVHLKALETYEVIFKIIGTKWLAKDLFIYSSGLFPLLGHAAMSLKPVLLTLYERYFLPLQRALLPSLQAFIMGLLPGLEEGAEVYERTDALLVKLSVLVGQSVFYGALWGSVLICPLVRLPASLFIVAHFDLSDTAREQKYMLGTDHRLVVKAVCLALQDSNVLVQRNMLEILLYFFPFTSCQDPEECAFPLKQDEVISVVSAASLTLLRRDMSLNRRLYAWMLGLDIKGGMVAADSSRFNTVEEYTAFYFGTHSRELLVQAVVNILKQKDIEANPDNLIEYLRPFRIILSLLDKSEIGPLVLSDVLLEVVRAFYSYCKVMLGEDSLNSSLSGSQLDSKIKENKNSSEIIKTVNMLVSAMSSNYLWDYMTRHFQICLSSLSDPAGKHPSKAWSSPPSVTELSTLIIFLMDVIPLELYAEIQTQCLPQMLGSMLQSLRSHMTSLSLQELTQALRACFKVLSNIQMPVAYKDMEAESQTQDLEQTRIVMTGNNKVKESDQVNGNHDDSSSEVGLNGQERQEAEPGVVTYPALHSEDSGLGLSASPSEQHLLPGRNGSDAASGVNPEAEDVWRRGGTIENMSKCVQDILASVITRHLLDVVDPEKKKKQEAANQLDPNAPPRGSKRSPLKRKGSRDLGLIKDRLAEFFNPSKLRIHALHGSSRDGDKNHRPAVLEWMGNFQSKSKGEISESCRQAFTVVCQLLLECTTFPVYFTEEENQDLQTSMFNKTGIEGTLPDWLRSLMTLCCLTKDYQVQHVAISSLLELINHSQSLALVIQDKNQRYKNSDANPLSGQLQMVTLPPIYPAVLKTLEDSTDFYLRVSQVLWAQLDTERREHHVSCVELFYRLHCLAPSASICEDIICLGLLSGDKVVCLEALHRFSVLWHLTREIQTNRSTSLNRSFDRSLFVVLDRLNNQDGSVSAAAQNWLVRALSLSDVVRILEPVLLLLLDPRTQRSPIQSIKQNLSVGNLKALTWRDRSITKSAGDNMTPGCQTGESFVRRITIVDREALWAELERDPELTPPDSPTMSRSESEETEGEDEEVGEEEESEHTESADTSGTQNSTENSSSSSAPYLQRHDDGSIEEEGVTNGLQRVDSERTQVSDSLSSDEDDGQLEAIAKSRLLKRQREKREAVDSLFRHVLLYKQQYESSRILYAFTILETILRTSAGPFVEALSSTSLDCSSIAHLNLIQNLLQRHRQAQDGGSFYGRLQTSTPPSGPTPDPSQPAFSPLHSPCSPSSPPTLLLELLTCLCMRYLRSHYPSYASIPTRQLQANREVQVKSVEVLTELMIQLVWVAQQAQIGEAKGTASLEAVHNLLWGYKVQQYVLLMLSASMIVCQRADRPDQHTLPEEDQGGDVGEISEESLINFGRDGIWTEHPLQIALLKLLKVLIVLEHHVCPPHTKAQDHDQSHSNPQQRAEPSALAREWQTAVMFQQSIKAVRYVTSQPITAQGMFVSAAARALHPQYGCAMHPAWVTLLCEVLPYLGRSLAIIVSPIIAQICRNLDELVKQHEHDGIKASHNGTLKRENIAPDYPLTLLEGLTTLTHYCLLDHRKTAAACDVPDLRNASNAILEEFPHMISSMALLWGVVKGCDSTHGSRASPTSVYFKGTKILRQKVLEFLMPLTQQFGVQVMTSVATVWSSRKSRKRRSRNKILPDASDSQMTLVDLVKALNTLRTDTILQLIREVVKKPHQIKGDQKTTLVDIPVLQFSYVYIQSLTAQALQENINPLLSLLRESVQLNLAPPGHFLLLGILDDCVNRLPNIDNKRDTKELQEVSQRILEAVGAVAGSSLEQTSWLSRNLEVKAQPQVCLQGDEDDHDGNELEECAGQGSAMVSSSAPSVFSVQALVLLAEVLAPLLDMVYRSDEKEKAVPLISRLMYYVFPYLKNHSAYNMPSFCAGAQLLSSLSGYAYTKRAWKKEVLELFMDPMFFTMESSCSCHWRSIIDHLLTHEKTMFKDLMSMQSSSLKLFNSAEQKPMLLKRQAFAMFSGENDQYHFYLPLIQERLTENLRVGQTPSVSAQMFLMFRVLLLRISPQHLTSLWPIMVTELMRIFNRLEKKLLDDKEVSKSKLRGGHDKNGLLFPQAELDMYLSACKFLDNAVSFPPEDMPLFQMYRWAFIPEVDVDHYDGPGNTLLEGEQECKPHIVRILDGINRRYGLNGTAGESNTDRVEFPLLTLRSLCSIVDLVPFFSTLCCSFNGSSVHLPHYVADYPPSSSDQVMKRLEHIIEGEFLDGMDN
ncbi:protein dopey-2-like isoform X2 [Sinocyclocheilus rhinocerous]|uniref:protein dopey-2-like isoform X2 n=1 Tax=Sinocyclocheilus rhinocerous TaxID=307959 RepID=UPI0007B89CFA|nr:PREDICTED: protein dopey-2-like isoform X2 [Sinocyclocheilus rhinocerous]